MTVGHGRNMFVNKWKAGHIMKLLASLILNVDTLYPGFDGRSFSWNVLVCHWSWSVARSPALVC